MILIDRALEKRETENRPIRIGMVGAGFMGKALARHIVNVVKGMCLVAISNRSIHKASDAFKAAGCSSAKQVSNLQDLTFEIERGRPAVTEDPYLLCHSEAIDVILDVTGSVDFGASVALQAMEHGKHVVTMNAELQGTLGPLLSDFAARQGVVFTDSDGDQPGVMMNLYRFVRGIGVKPALIGNIKGLLDPYRNPRTQIQFARKWCEKPKMVASFADGTKMSFEQAVIANAVGMTVAQTGMLGIRVPEGMNIAEAAKKFPADLLMQGTGIVDYVIGAHPAPGVFIIGMQTEPVERRFLEMYKMGEGPFYCFYTPYHLCHLEAAHSIARAVLFQDATVSALGAPCVDVVATAKRNIRAGEVLDGFGGFLSYGQCEKAEVTVQRRLLPMGLSEGCVLKRDVSKNSILTYDDVLLPEGLLMHQLRKDQDKLFFGAVRDLQKESIC